MRRDCDRGVTDGWNVATGSDGRPGDRRTPTGVRIGTGTVAQANLVALAAALLALATVTVLGVAVADRALIGEDRPSGEHHAATALSERLVSVDSPLTRRQNVLGEASVGQVTAADIRRWFPVLGDRAVEVRLGSTVLASRGTPAGGTTVRRIVLVERTQRRTHRPSFSGGNEVTLPRRTPTLTVELTPPDNVSVTDVRANDRVVLRDPSGLRGRYRVSLSRRETVTLSFRANDSLAPGDVTLTTRPRRTRKSELVVTVDA